MREIARDHGSKLHHQYIIIITADKNDDAKTCTSIEDKNKIIINKPGYLKSHTSAARKENKEKKSLTKAVAMREIIAQKREKRKKSRVSLHHTRSIIPWSNYPKPSEEPPDQLPIRSVVPLCLVSPINTPKYFSHVVAKTSK